LFSFTYLFNSTQIQIQIDLFQNNTSCCWRLLQWMVYLYCSWSWSKWMFTNSDQTSSNPSSNWSCIC